MKVPEGIPSYMHDREAIRRTHVQSAIQDRGGGGISRKSQHIPDQIDKWGQDPDPAPDEGLSMVYEKCFIAAGYKTYTFGYRLPWVLAFVIGILETP